MNALSFYYVYRLAPRLQARELACPIDDPRCRVAGRFSRSLLTVSTVIWAAGFFVAFLLGPILWRLKP